jgi:hypothetical protein
MRSGARTDAHPNVAVRSPAALWIRPSTAAWNSRFHRRATSGRSIATVIPANASTLLTWVPPSGSGLKLHR